MSDIGFLTHELGPIILRWAIRSQSFDASSFVMERALLGSKQSLLGLERARRFQIGPSQAKNGPSGLGPVMPAMGLSELGNASWPGGKHDYGTVLVGHGVMLL